MCRARRNTRVSRVLRVSCEACILLGVLFFAEVRLLADYVRFIDERNSKRFFLSLCHIDVTLGDVVNSCPFRNMVDAVELKGKDLLQVFELSASKFGTWGFLQVSGIFLFLFTIIEQLPNHTVKLLRTTPRRHKLFITDCPANLNAIWFVEAFNQRTMCQL